MDQQDTPLYDALMNQKKKNPLSFHVPGHKYGKVFPHKGKEDFRSILQLDATEIAGLDDLHHPEGAIADAQRLTSQLFNSHESYFLVNGSTSGNISMVLSVCEPGDKIIVQRNSHKSVLHGLELAGAQPVFLTPDFDEETSRYSDMSCASIQSALEEYPEAKAVVLTYPDYFGRTFDMKSIIHTCHRYQIPVLVDEAHGVHFSRSSLFPPSSLDLGADLVVQSAHKLAPAMTMGSYLHVKSDWIHIPKLEHYLQVIQSSSPSYPIMASLDLARYYLAHYQTAHLKEYIYQIREVFQSCKAWKILSLTAQDDPLKIVMEPAAALNGYETAEAFEREGIYPELATHNQVLFVLGMENYLEDQEFKKKVHRVNSQLKNMTESATIEKVHVEFPKMQTLDKTYLTMRTMSFEFKSWQEAVGKIAAVSVIPYPPGIPYLLKGEVITSNHRKTIAALMKSGAKFQNKNIAEGIQVFKGE
ncbi:aminotransferase class I/II-fold pyridoxal phosphate-dependent enzyme [Halobacillus salinarum]|uniref:Aminotransferase class I/II-fold pyridoxal phosphate-dependent enzyme n=1 Tax=Halobacillus salinarum TaxID=2932257 RepID=A0ABY4EJN9_9BACI|nr:aminotransferase class I/II-fold pyridoxal phosphate-dependent enzyme [Halobacillus salinarum]UOQ44695.1 aminotransferase class I/II-fold pyridoxal phosphate-dependent enzyme [Halobacillus salinarum]